MTENKSNKSSELLWVFGLVFVAFGVAFCSKADLGVSMIAAPAFVIYEAIADLSNILSVGMTEYIFQGVLLLIMCISVRKFNWRYLLAFLSAVLYGYMLNIALFVLKDITFDAIWLRYLMLLWGDILTAFGVACFFRTYLPLQVYELFVSVISNHFKKNLVRTKRAFDITLLIASVILAIVLFRDFRSFDWSTIWYSSFHSLGVGTIITTIINAFLISNLGKAVDKIFGTKPLFPKLEKFLKAE